MYITYAEYVAIYGETVQETVFPRLEYEARRRIDNETTGIDGVRKLKLYYPTDPDDVEAVTVTLCRLIAELNELDQLNKSASAAAGYIVHEDGTVTSKLLSSMSSGSESISFANSDNAKASALDRVRNDTAALDAYFRAIITDGLEGVHDSNGVNLLYMGTYPCIETQ